MIYVNDLLDRLTSICKIFADDTSPFSKVFNINESANDLNIDLKKISQWAYQWKMQLNPDPNKQANEVIFSWKSNSSSLTYPPLPPVKFNNINITRCSHQKHLGIILDLKLDFNNHVAQKIITCSKLIGLMKRCQ